MLTNKALETGEPITNPGVFHIAKKGNPPMAKRIQVVQGKLDTSNLIKRDQWSSNGCPTCNGDRRSRAPFKQLEEGRGARHVPQQKESIFEMSKIIGPLTDP
jgi:hypothetical protein